MSGPWEDFQGPWSDFKPAKKAGPWDDFAKAMSAESELAVAGSGTATALAAGAVAFPAAGIAGLGALKAGGGEKEVYEAMEATNKAISPELSPIDEAAVRKLMYPLEALNKGATVAQEYVTEKTGSKIAGATVGTGIEAGALLLGPKAAGKAKEGVRRVVTDIKELKGMEGPWSEFKTPDMPRTAKPWEEFKTDEVKTTVEEVKPIEEPKPEVKVEEVKTEPTTEPVAETPKVETPPPTEGKPTSTKNAVSEAERLERDMDPVEKEVRRVTPTYEEAKTLVAEGKSDPRALAQAVVDTPNRPISAIEEGILGHDKVRLLNEERAVEEAINKAIDAGDKDAEAVLRAQWDRVQKDIDINTQATNRIGSEWSIIGKIKQAQLKLDYTVGAMVRKYKAKTGKEPTPEIKTKLEDYANQIKDLTRKIEERDGRISDLEAQKVVKKIEVEVARERRAAKRQATKQDLYAEREVLLNDLKAALTEQRGSFSFKESTRENSAKIMGKLAKNYVHEGIVNVEAIVDSIHTSLQKMGIELSKREIRDLFSGYGITRELSKKEIDVQLRELKRIARLQSALEDALSGKSPKHSGLRRDQMSQVVREMTTEVKEAMKKAGIETEVGAQRWRSTLDSIKKRLDNNIADSAKRIKEGKDIPKKEGIKYDSETKVLQSYRDILRWIEEIRQEKPGMSPEQRTRMALKAAERAVTELERKVTTGDIAPKKPLGQTPVTPELKALRDKRDTLQKQLNQMRKDAKPKSDPQYAKTLRDLKAAEKSIGEYRRKLIEKDFTTKKKAKKEQSSIVAEAREYRDGLRKAYQEMIREAKPKKSKEQIALQSYKTRTKNRIAELEGKIERGDFTKREKRKIEMDKESLDLKFQRDKIQKQFDELVFKEQLANRTKLQKAGAGVMEAMNLVRSIKTSMDLSAVLRQGAFIVFSHPIRGIKAMPAMFEALRSEKGQFAINQEILNRPNYSKYQDSKLYLSEHGHTLSKMEEAYMSRWSDKIPGVAASQRAYTTFLNRLRADSFDAMAASLSKNGKPTPQEMTAISNYINVATGRGKVGMKDTAAVGLNTAFFAPRYVASRFQLLAGQPLYGGSMATRAMIAKEYARFLTGLGVVYGLGTMAGGDVSFDPRSSDFGKLKFGNTRVDPLAGLSQSTVLLGRLASGETKTTTGKVLSIRGDNVKYGGSDAADVIARFLRSKLAPVPAIGVDIATGKNYVGEPIDAQYALKQAVPLAFNDIYETMKEQGVAAGTALALLSIFGMGIQTYEPKRRR